MYRAITRHRDSSLHMRLRRLAVVLLPLAFGACLSGTDYTTNPNATPNIPIEQTTFAPALNVDLTQSTKTGSGMYIRDLTVGAGPAATSTSTVSVYYQGFLSSGQRFDFTLSPSAPFGPLKLGANSVIKGWEEGLIGMKVGGTRQLIIPPALAYGTAGYVDNVGRVVIPPNAVLVFNIELVSVQ
jgi:FKBP-type peptidyl-prolyl cis-trans isomerase